MKLFTLLFILILSCDFSNDTLEIKAIDNGLQATNASSEQIFYHIISSSDAPLALWLPHTDQERSIPANSTKFILLDEFIHGDERILFYYWTSSTLKNVKSTEIKLNR